MNERHIARTLVSYLDDGTQHLDAKIRNRLFESRQKAVAAQRVAECRVSLADAAATLGANVRIEIGAVRRNWVLLLMLVFLAGAFQFWGNAQRLAEIEEVDSALLIDDLPIDAYLDRGFNTWLHDSSKD